jgi:hypothetical protein
LVEVRAQRDQPRPGGWHVISTEPATTDDIRAALDALPESERAKLVVHAERERLKQRAIAEALGCANTGETGNAVQRPSWEEMVGRVQTLVARANSLEDRAYRQPADEHRAEVAERDAAKLRQRCDEYRDQLQGAEDAARRAEKQVEELRKELAARTSDRAGRMRSERDRLLIAAANTGWVPAEMTADDGVRAIEQLRDHKHAAEQETTRIGRELVEARKAHYDECQTLRRERSAYQCDCDAALKRVAKLEATVERVRQEVELFRKNARLNREAPIRDGSNLEWAECREFCAERIEEALTATTSSPGPSSVDGPAEPPAEAGEYPTGEEGATL